MNNTNKNIKPLFREILAGSPQSFSEARKLMSTSIEWEDEVERIKSADDKVVSFSKEEHKRTMATDTNRQMP